MIKEFKISHSAVNDFKRCPEKYHLLRTDGIRPKVKGASLYFGGAVDLALGFLLEHLKVGTIELGLKEYKNIFLNDKEKGWNQSFDVDSIKYSSKDFVNSLIELDPIISIWEKELNITKDDCLKELKQKTYKKPSDKSIKLYSRLCWLSLKTKAFLMLEGFVRDIIPNIEEVIALQHKITGEIEVGTEKVPIVGYIDLICKYKGYNKPVVFDIKTAAMPYEDDAIKLSEQLMMYLSAVGDELDTTLAGYIIMLKSMSSDDICSKCSIAKAEGSRHKTCNQEIGGERCHGEWKSIPKASTQFMVEEISKEQQKKFLTNVANIAKVIRETRYQNLDSCHDFGLCEFYALCHYNKREDYIFPNDNKQLEIKNEETNEFTID